MSELYYPPWMRSSPEMMEAYRLAWEDTGDLELALDEVRKTDAYAAQFQGNLRTDGTVRYDENTYLSVKESYENILLSVDLNPSLFEHQFGNLIQGMVAPAEFATRVESLYERVIGNAEAIKEYYDTNFATQMSTSGIMASLLDPEVGQSIINKQIAMSEVGGNAAMRGFNIVTDFAKQLVDAGLDTSSEAAQFFGLAEGMLPTLQVLAERHMDPEDDFSLEDFAAAQVFTDANQRRRIRQMTEAESVSFARRTFSADTSGFTGLVDQG